MALFFDGPVPLDAITTFVQENPRPANTGLTGLFPTRYFDTDEVDFATLTHTNQAVTFRNWDASPGVLARDTGSEKRVKMLPLGASLSQGEYERRQIEFARLGGTIAATLVDAVYNDVQILTAGVHNRVELAWGDVLLDGVLTLAENNVYQSVDYGVPGGNLVTPATLWSAGSPTPLTDLVAWVDAYIALNGVPPGMFRTSQKVLRLLQKSAEIIAAVAGTNTGRTRVTVAELNDLLASEGLPVFDASSLYNSNFKVGGTDTRVIPDNRLLMLPADPGQLGFTAWGTPTTAFELKANDLQVEPGIVGALVREDALPFRKYAFVDAVAMPVIADPNKLMVATVAA